MLVVETIAKILRACFHQRKSIKQICRELRVSRNVVRKVIRSGQTEFTYEVGYDAVRRYADPWGQREHEVTAAAFVPLSFDPGEAYQFDWSHEIVVIEGVTTTVNVAHMRRCHSRMPFVPIGKADWRIC